MTAWPDERAALEEFHRVHQDPPEATSDIETCVRSSTTCILANLSMRFRRGWMGRKERTVAQAEVKPHLKSHYRAPWKLEV